MENNDDIFKKDNPGIRLLRWLNPLSPWEWGMAAVIFLIAWMVWIAHG